MPSEQPSPIPNASPPIWQMVIADMQARDKIGRERYVTPLQAHNGRDALQDAYEEALDLTVYMKQAIVERDSAWNEAMEAAAKIAEERSAACYDARTKIMAGELYQSLDRESTAATEACAGHEARHIASIVRSLKRPAND